MFTLDIFIHLDAVDRKQWTGSPDDRPLTELGLKQAEFMAETLTRRTVDAIVSSPALRCQQSVGPLAEKAGVPVRVDGGFCDTRGYRPPEGWGAGGSSDGPSPLGGALAAGSAFAALTRLQGEFPDGRVVLCSYGDVVPALLAFVAGNYQTAMPERSNAKGVLFTIGVSDDAARMVTTQAPNDFPA